jgi:hypothetical protein
VASTAAVIAAAAKALHRLVVDTVPKTQTQQEATDKLIQECRKSWTDDEMRMLITHLDRALLRRWTQFNRAGIAIGVAAQRRLRHQRNVVGKPDRSGEVRPSKFRRNSAPGTVQGRRGAWPGLMRLNDIARAQWTCGPQGGGTACSIALWMKPPTAAEN